MHPHGGGGGVGSESQSLSTTKCEEAASKDYAIMIFFFFCVLGEWRRCKCINSTIVEAAPFW